MDRIIVVTLLWLTWVMRVSSTVAIGGPAIGVTAGMGERPFRQEISIFQNSGPAWDLYLQSLSYVMERDQSELLSYYQVAGCEPQVSHRGKGILSRG